MVEVRKMNFAGRDYIVMDKFTFEDKEYICLYEDVLKELKTLNRSIIVDFVYKCDDGMYENVVDDNLYERLLVEESKRQNSGDNEIYKLYMKSFQN